jgi:tyrosinase
MKQLGVHGGGHFGVGKPLTDLYTSPEDPVFYLHHA